MTKVGLSMRHVALAVAVATSMDAFATKALASSEELLSASQIREKVVGKRIYLATPLGGEFPLYYRTDGQVDGSGEALGIGKWVRPTDKGRWWISSNQLCQKWQTWYDGKPMCFTLRKITDDRLAWTQDNGDKGTARIGK
jgi:hypothetical protein